MLGIDIAHVLSTTTRLAVALSVAALTGCATSAVADTSSQSRLVAVDVYDRNDGTSLPVYTKDGRRYVVGTPGHEYAVRIRNCTGDRILAVTSVDGVNVVSGETASPNQSGYVIDAWGSVEIAGWRKSFERTAAFYFTDLGDSYAARTGRPGDVGVIGVAVFKERRPPIVQAPLRDRIADSAEPRNEKPAASPPPAASGRAAQAERDDVTRAESEPRFAAKLGTGHGRSETSYAAQVRFERASSDPIEVVALQYDRRDNLIAMGVLPSPRYAQRQPNPFPSRFVPDPR